MDAISNSDRLMTLLRQRLRERAASSAGTKAGASGSRAGAAAPQGLAALSSLQGMDQGQLRRTCIQALLADQLGSGLINDPRFQQVVSRVTDAIGADPQASNLLDRVVSDLRVP